MTTHWDYTADIKRLSLDTVRNLTITDDAHTHQQGELVDLIVSITRTVDDSFNFHEQQVKRITDIDDDLNGHICSIVDSSVCMAFYVGLQIGSGDGRCVGSQVPTFQLLDDGPSNLHIIH